MVTIAEIARRANASKATVSRVLNGHPAVDPRTAARVRAIVAEVGYVPRASARALANGRARCIGFLVPSLTVPWLLELLRGVADEVEAADHTLALHTIARGEASLAAFSAQVAARAIDGLVAVLPRDVPSLAGLRARGLPVVLIDDRDGAPGFPRVWTTDRLGGYQATRHLLTLGRAPVAVITGPLASVGGQDRLAGYRRALAEAGVAFDPDLVRSGDWTEASGGAAMDRLLAAHPELRGAFVANDLMAFGAMRALAESGRQVPSDVAVVGFDDIPAAAHTTPALTTVRQPLYEMGRTAVRAVFAALAGETLATEPCLLPTSLVVRGSCGAARRDAAGPSGPPTRSAKVDGRKEVAEGISRIRADRKQRSHRSGRT